VSNITHNFVGNLTFFPAVKELWKSVKIWRNYRHKRVARFIWDTVYFMFINIAYMSSSSSSSLKFLEWPKQQRHHEDHMSVWNCCTGRLRVSVCILYRLLWVWLSRVSVALSFVGHICHWVWRPTGSLLQAQMANCLRQHVWWHGGARCLLQPWLPQVSRNLRGGSRSGFRGLNPLPVDTAELDTKYVSERFIQSHLWRVFQCFAAESYLSDFDEKLTYRVS